MAYELDALDKRILAELDVNGRAGYSEIGKRLRVSKERVRYRIEKLEKDGIITGYYAVVDQAKLGYIPFRVYVKLGSLGKRGDVEFIDYLTKRDDVWMVVSVSGNFHAAFATWAKNVWDFYDFWQELMAHYGDNISWFQICPMTKFTEFNRQYLFGEGKKRERTEFTEFARCEPVRVDETDLRILRMLCKNARTPLDQIAGELGVSLMVVRYRLRKLRENRVLLGFRARIDHMKLGYHYYKVDVMFGERKRGEEFKRHILANPNVVYTEDTIQGSDFEFDVHVKGLGELLEMMDEARGKFGKTIKEYWYYSLLKFHKTEYIPALPE